MTKAPKRTAEFDAKIVAYLPYLQKQARRMERDPQAQEDLVADTVARLLERHAAYREDGGFVNWMYWTMRGVVSDKRSKVNREYEDPDGKAAAAIHLPAEQESVVYISEVMARIPRKHQDTVVKLMEGWTHKEIAADRGVTRQAVADILRRARPTLARAA